MIKRNQGANFKISPKPRFYVKGNYTNFSFLPTIRIKELILVILNHGSITITESGTQRHKELNIYHLILLSLRWFKAIERLKGPPSSIIVDQSPLEQFKIYNTRGVKSQLSAQELIKGVEPEEDLQRLN